MNDMISNYLELIDWVIAEGKYKDNWASLSNYPVPEWYRNAKFGIFIHWGVYSVPAFGNEWYPRNMYIRGTKEFEHHRKTFGEHKEFGYKDFIPMFKAEQFDAREWMKLFKEAGARYVMPVGEHHDGFQMYASQLSRWNAAEMGPKRDVLGELRAAADAEGITFCVSSHRAENFFFFAGGRDFDSGIREMVFEEPYGFADRHFSKMHTETHDIESTPASREHLDNWLARSCELVDRFQPRIVWFDWWIHNLSFKPYLKKFAAYYYNRALEWGVEVAINYKYDAFLYTSAVFDIERGQAAAIKPRLWQNDTAIAKNSWGYTESNDFKKPEDIVCDLIDVVSKNGCLLLNVGPKSDGTITEEEQAVLRQIGAWMKVNGESIYDTRPWLVFGEGSTEVPEGAFTDVNRAAFTSEDIRFTYHAPYLYVNVLSWPKDNHVAVRSLKQYSPIFNGHIAAVELLGYDNAVEFKRTKAGLMIAVAGSLDTSYPVCFKI
ncbi:MAG: alpha-L-fucosidase, partial [Anaerolineaceae bacterium]|nr:alpha-L-fucosidase [Anaerolineaceae bacterium]